MSAALSAIATGCSSSTPADAEPHRLSPEAGSAMVTYRGFAIISAQSYCGTELDCYPQEFAMEYSTADDSGLAGCIAALSRFHIDDLLPKGPSFCKREQVEQCSAVMLAQSCTQLDSDSENPCQICLYDI